MKKIIAVFAAILISQEMTAQVTETTGHPLFTMMQNYSIDRYSIVSRDFDRLKIIVPDKKSSSGSSETFKEGVYEECGYNFNGEMNKAPSKLAILKNFENAVIQKGGTMIWRDDFYQDKEFFKLKKGNDTYWIKVYTDGIGNYKISSVKEAPMKQEVAMTAADIKSTLALEGKVSLYGIYFDTDKAVVQPESEPTLKAIADYLKQNPANVFIVGHTDNTGDYLRNTNLSKERAAAVVNELSTKYGINKSLLTPQGVGPLSPVASNETEEGKAKNRRVEIVLK